jgi:hypothetical protein
LLLVLWLRGLGKRRPVQQAKRKRGGVQKAHVGSSQAAAGCNPTIIAGGGLGNRWPRAKRQAAEHDVYSQNKLLTRLPHQEAGFCLVRALSPATFRMSSRQRLTLLFLV